MLWQARNFSNFAICCNGFYCALCWLPLTSFYKGRILSQIEVSKSINFIYIDKFIQETIFIYIPTYHLPTIFQALHNNVKIIYLVIKTSHHPDDVLNLPVIVQSPLLNDVKSGYCLNGWPSKTSSDQWPTDQVRLFFQRQPRLTNFGEVYTHYYM